MQNMKIIVLNWNWEHKKIHFMSSQIKVSSLLKIDGFSLFFIFKINKNKNKFQKLTETYPFESSVTIKLPPPIKYRIHHFHQPTIHSSTHCLFIYIEVIKFVSLFIFGHRQVFLPIFSLAGHSWEIIFMGFTRKNILISTSNCK